MTHRHDDKESENAGLELALDIWSRRKGIALVVFGTVFAAALSIALSLPNRYGATATVLVETQHVSEEFVRSSVTAEVETRIQTIREEVMSRARLGDLVTRLDLYRDLRAKGLAFDLIIERMRKDIELELNTVAPTGGRTPTIAFAIKYSGRDPRTVALVANQLASLYVVENSKIREGQAARTADFLKAQLEDVRKELTAQERRVSDFNLNHIGELPQQTAANLASLERLNTQLRLNGENQVRAMDRRERFERQWADLASTPAPAVPVEPGRPPVPPELIKMRQHVDELERKFTGRYPEVIQARAELAELERQLAERPSEAKPAANATAPTAVPVDPKTRLLQAIADTEAELTALKSEEAAFRQAIRSYEDRVENVPKRQEEFEQLSRDTATTKERYETLLKRYEEAQLASSLEQGQKVEQFRILDPAIPPREPSAPSRVRLAAIGLFLALALAVGSVLLVEKIDTAFHSIADLRAFVAVPTLFSIPRILTATETRRRRRRVALAAVSVAIGLALVVSGSRYVARDNDTLVRLTGGTRG